MKQFSNYLAFKTPVMFDSHVSYGGIGGMELTVDPNFQPWLHVRRYGTVVEVPYRLGTIPLPVQLPQGCPPYHEITTPMFKFLKDIEMEVQIGDKIYFDHMAVNKRQLIVTEGDTPENRMHYFRIRYDQVFCAVRDEKIIPIGSHTLVEPDYEDWDDILKPVYSTIKDKDGKFMVKDKSQWLQTKVAPGVKYLKGFIRHIGSPLIGDQPCACKVGDHILYYKHADYLTKIEGTDYYPIPQRHILGRFLQGN